MILLAIPVLVALYVIATNPGALADPGTFISAIAGPALVLFGICAALLFAALCLGFFFLVRDLARPKRRL